MHGCQTVAKLQKRAKRKAKHLANWFLLHAIGKVIYMYALHAILLTILDTARYWIRFEIDDQSLLLTTCFERRRQNATSYPCIAQYICLICAHDSVFWNMQFVYVFCRWGGWCNFITGLFRWKASLWNMGINRPMAKAHAALNHAMRSKFGCWGILGDSQQGANCEQSVPSFAYGLSSHIFQRNPSLVE